MRQSGCCERCDKSCGLCGAKPLLRQASLILLLCLFFSPWILPPPHHFTPEDSSVPFPLPPHSFSTSGEVRGGETKGLLPSDPGLCQHLAAPVPIPWRGSGCHHYPCPDIAFSHASIELLKNLRFISESVKTN